MVPDEFPQDAAHAHLLFGSKFFARDDRIIGFLHLVFLECHLHDLIAKINEGDACGVVTAVHDHVDSVSELLVVVEEMNGIGVVIHSSFVLDYGAKIGIISKLATFWSTSEHFFTPYINMSGRFRTFAGENWLSAFSYQLSRTELIADSFYHFKNMVTELLLVWIVGVVAFFTLWAVLAKVIKWIGERKHNDAMGHEDAAPTETTPDKDGTTDN